MTRFAPLALLLLLGGCQTFELTPPGDFVKLSEPDWSDYALRATNADGVVLAVREIPDEQRGSLGFWTQAVRNRLRDTHAYALLEEQPVQAASGQAGVRLRFGRDEGQRPYDYWVTLFVDDRGPLSGYWLFVLEAGGEREVFARSQGAVEQALAGFAIQ